MISIFPSMGFALRFNARTDKNQEELIKAIQAIGGTVIILAARKKGTPDLLVGFRGVNYLIEVKTDKGVLGDAQKQFLRDWRGQVNVARNLEDVLRIIGALTNGTKG